LFLGAVLRTVRRLIHRQLPDFFAELDCRFERQAGARGRPEDEGRPAGRLDEGVDVFHFALDRERPGIAALAAPAPVVNVDCEARREQLGQLAHGSERAVA